MDEIEYLKLLAGVNQYNGYQPVTVENMSKTAAELKKKEKKLGLKPGDQDWFKLWFSLPYMTGKPSFRGRTK